MNIHMPRPQLFVAAGLAILMAATRFNHFGSAVHLPDASLAVFFLAGIYCSGRWVFPALFAEAVIIDAIAVATGASPWCFTPAYVFLLPAYGALWLAGRWQRHHHRPRLAGALRFTAALGLGTTAAYIVSSGSFFLFSQRLEDMSLSTYLMETGGYFLPYLWSAALYAALGVGIHAAATCALTPAAAGRRHGH